MLFYRQCAFLGLLCTLPWTLRQPAMAQGQTAATADPVQRWCTQHLEEIESLYRYFHSHPELSFQEQATAARVAQEYDALGAEVTTDVGGHGVVGVLKNGSGPVLMLRTDLDALPVTEKTGLVYASRAIVATDEGGSVGVMHACGHDIHMSSQIGAAQFLAQNRDRWQGTLLLIGQPAEERGAGAKAMLDDRLFERFPKPDFAVALHVGADLATGSISFRSGFQQANVDSVDITVLGRGGHGAYPHTTVDPIVQAAELILSLQTIVSREVPPTESAVVTVGSIRAGSKHNVIPDQCQLQLTVRSYAPEVRQLLLKAIRRKSLAVATAFGAPTPLIRVSEGTPSLFNDEQLASRLRPVFSQTLGPANVHISDPSMGGEDFSRYGQAGVPILMIRLGSVNPQRLARFESLQEPPPSLHSAKYYPDAVETLRTGIRTLVATATELLPTSPP